MEATNQPATREAAAADAAELERVVVRVEVAALVEAAGKAAIERAATRAAALAEATTLVETTTGQAASTVEAMGRELVWRRSWRRLETTGRQRC